MNNLKQIDELKKSIVNGTYSTEESDIRDFSINNPGDSSIKPDCILRPAGTDELINIVIAANKSGLNLTVSSSKGPHQKGGYAASERHAHIDLSSWDQIEWINRRNRVCQIQPGVTYGQLLKALEPHGMTIPVPLAPRSGKSVLAAVMDREPSTWPNKQWDINDPAASTEFIFGSGELFRTGAAGGPGSIEKQRAAGGAQKCPMGPSQTDFDRVLQGAQGTMGIITWITMRTELLPSVQKTFVLGSDTPDQLITFTYEVQRPWLGEHSFILDRTAAAMLMSAAGHGNYKEITDYLPGYICLQNIAGFERLPEERVQYQIKDINAIASRAGLAMKPAIGPVSGIGLLSAALTPGKIDWRRAHKGECLSVFFLTTLDRTPEFEKKYRSIAEKNGFNSNDTGLYIQPVVQNHACHMEMMTCFDPSDAENVNRAASLEKEAVMALIDTGAFFSRPYGPADIVFRQNPVNYKLVKKIKDIFDPNHVLNRGKWNI